MAEAGHSPLRGAMCAAGIGCPQRPFERFQMAEPLSNSPQPRSDAWTSTSGSASVVPFEMLAQRCWGGLELRVCREDIGGLVQWSIQQPRHALIVHLGGSMRALETEIDGLGRLSGPPSPGDIWLVPAGRRYTSEAKGRVITYAELGIDADAEVPTCPDRAPLRLAPLGPRMAHRDEFLYYAVAQLARLLCEPDDLAGMMAERAQWLLRQHLQREYGHASALVASRRGPMLGSAQSQRLGDYIEAHLAEPMSLVRLADAVGMSVHQLLIAFRAAFGTTPAQFILERRLSRARSLLMHTGQAVSDIALATGFSSHSHFAAAFRTRHGLSPSDFRGAHRTLVI